MKAKYERNRSLTLTVTEAARQLGISDHLAWRLVRAGELPTVRLGRLVRVPRVQLMKLLEGNNGSTGSG